MNRRAASGILLGLLVIAFGVLALFKGIFGWWFTVTFESFVGLIFAGFSVASIVHRGFRFWNVVFLILGGWMFIRGLGILPHGAFMILASALLVLLGVFIIVSAAAHPHHSAHFDGADQKAGSSDYVNCDNVFSHVNVKNGSKRFEGGSVSSTFGTVRLDLSDIAFERDAVLEVSSVFSTVEIRLPRNVPYTTDVTPVLGSFVNSAPIVRPVQGAPCLRIQGTAVFGSCRLV